MYKANLDVQVQILTLNIFCPYDSFSDVFPISDRRGPAANWRNEQRFLLRKKIMEAQSLISPEKSFFLPVYAERHARLVDSSRHLLRWESKGKRTKRGPGGKFSTSHFVDDQAGVGKYLDLSAESTSASGSSEADESQDQLSRSTSCGSLFGADQSDGSSGESDPPVDFFSVPA
ncbi:unnamed protein product [Calypogeia fissa]